MGNVFLARSLSFYGGNLHWISISMLPFYNMEYSINQGKLRRVTQLGLWVFRHLYVNTNVFVLRWLFKFTSIGRGAQ